MAIDSTLPVRRAILIAMKDAPHLNELLPPENIHSQRPPSNPEWPFSLYENTGISRPIVATGLDGQELDVRLHVFAKPRVVAGFTVETAEDHAARILERMSKVLDRRYFVINRGHITTAWRGSAVMVDRDEADAFHGLCNLRIRAFTV